MGLPLYTLNSYPCGPSLDQFRSRISCFSDTTCTRSAKNWKCTEWPQTKLEHLTVKSTLYTLNTYPCGPNFRSFRSTTSRFRDTKSSKIGNAPSDPKLNLNTSKVPYVNYVLSPEVQSLVRFALRPPVSKISHILSFPMDSHVKRPQKEPKKKKKCQKSTISQTSQFCIQL